MKRLLVLRPEPGASTTARRARERGLEPVTIPLFEIEAVDWDAPEPPSFDALLLTSANAVRCGGEKLTRFRFLPVHAVGAATAAAARAAGFDVASTGDSGVDRLLDSLEPDLKLLHLSGEDRRLPDQARQSITPVAVYRARTLAADLRDAPGSVALIHSPSAGTRFAELINDAGVDRGSIIIVAISREAVQSVGKGWARIETAENPGDEALLALAARLCNKPDA